jgi:hypothetical protein
MDEILNLVQLRAVAVREQSEKVGFRVEVDPDS